MLKDSLTKLLELPATERVDIAMALWDSLTAAEQEAEFDLTSEQLAELDRALLNTLLNPLQPFPGTRCAGSSFGERDTASCSPAAGGGRATGRP